jgi:transposase-like protein
MIDAAEIARRIRAAMDWREPQIPSVLVARKCDVSPQAVHKWRKHGLIDLKKHLDSLADATQVPPMFYLEPEPGRSEETKAAWQRLTSWLSKAATVLLIAIPPFLAPTPSQAGEFNNNGFCRPFGGLNTHWRRWRLLWSLALT